MLDLASDAAPTGLTVGGPGLLFPPSPRETAIDIELASPPLWRRLVTALLATAAMVALLFSGERLLTSAPVVSLASGGSTELLSQTLLLVGVVILTQLLVGLRHVGLRIRGALTSFAMVLPLLVLSSLERGAIQLPQNTTIASLGLLCLMIGVAEEVYGRRLLVTVLGGRRHAALAIVGSAIGFAYLHLPGYVQHCGWRNALAMSTTSAAYACAGAIVRLRSGSIVGLIAFHTLDDWHSQVVELGGAQALGQAEPNLRAIVIGCLVSAIYWLVCSRGIRAGLGAERHAGV